MTIKADTFAAVVDTDLASFTPTGPFAGSAWNYNISGGGISAIAATGRATDTANNGNRARMVDDLGSDYMRVAAFFSSSAVHGEAVFFALQARIPLTGVASGLEAGYDFSVGTTDGKFFIEEAAFGGPTTLSGEIPWPGDNTSLVFLVKKDETMELWVNGVLTVQKSGIAGGAGRTAAGIQLGNFTGSAGKITVDNYSASNLRSLSPLYYQANRLMFVD